MRTNKNVIHEIFSTHTVDEIILEKGDNLYDLYCALGGLLCGQTLIDFAVDKDTGELMMQWEADG